MNRVIKFRIWDKSNKQFRDPEFLGGHLNDIFIPDDIYIFQQFTGLLDKNKKEIYEGDLLQNGAEGRPAVVNFEDGMFVVGRYRCELWRFAGDGKEIVGNIFENSDLLQ